MRLGADTVPAASPAGEACVKASVAPLRLMCIHLGISTLKASWLDRVHWPSPSRAAQHRQPFHGPRLDVLAHGTLGDADQTAHPDEPDASLCDELPRNCTAVPNTSAASSTLLVRASGSLDRRGCCLPAASPGQLPTYRAPRGHRRQMPGCSVQLGLLADAKLAPREFRHCRLIEGGRLTHHDHSS